MFFKQNHLFPLCSAFCPLTLHQAVQLATGDVIYDEFEDEIGRSGLETRLEHINHAELLLPSHHHHHQQNMTRLECYQNVVLLYIQKFH